METPKKFHENFKKARKFPTGNAVKKKSNLLKSKNQQLTTSSSSGAKKRVNISDHPRQRSCCGR